MHVRMFLPFHVRIHLCILLDLLTHPPTHTHAHTNTDKHTNTERYKHKHRRPCQAASTPFLVRLTVIVIIEVAPTTIGTA